MAPGDHRPPTQRPGRSCLTTDAASGTSVDHARSKLCRVRIPQRLRREPHSDASVRIQDLDGNERTLDSSEYDYDRGISELRIDPGALRASDVALDVQVVDPCVPRVR